MSWGENEVYMYNALGHQWSVLSFNITQALHATDMNSFFDPPFEFGVFMVDQGTSITSIARVTATENLNGTLVLCRDGAGMEPEQNITINLSGEYTVQNSIRG